MIQNQPNRNRDFPTLNANNLVNAYPYRGVEFFAKTDILRTILSVDLR